MRKTLLTLGLLAAPRAAFACPVCFGQSDSPLAWAVNMGVFVMLGLVTLVLSAFAAFFVYLMRRARLVADAPPAAESYEFGRDSQEGTARC
ncbi:MAG TPA: hypothetical protein VG222_02280 [Vicinamibacterales bacterium]|jgi:hypothetical protein|nr:hypothetical protein [Vicinamibacterales bacterium]